MDIESQLSSHLGEFKSAPFLFIGSGFSRRYLGLEDWKGLLRKFSDISGKSYEYYFSKANGDLPQLASLLANDFHEIWWNESKYNESRIVNKALITTKESPLKVEIANYLREKLYTYGLSSQNDSEIEQLKQVVVDGIITTNWDLVLEEIFPDFKIFIGQKELLFANPQNILEIYKIHGCVTEPESLVLTNGDYNRFKERNSYLAAKLLTIFIEHPVIFIGYGLGDSNILEILNSIIKCLTPENISKLKDRLIFVERDEEFEGDELFQGFLSVGEINLPITRLRTNNFSLIYKVLSKHKRRFSAKLLRHLKEQFYQIVVTNDSNGKVHAVDIEDNFNPEDIEFYCGVGISSKISNTGYSIPEIDDLCKDIIFDTKIYEPVQTVLQTLPHLLARTKNVPIFKYLKESKLLEPGSPILDYKIINRYNLEEKVFSTSNVFAKKKTIMNNYSDLASLLREYNFGNALELIPLLGKENINIDELGALIVRNFELLNNNNNTTRIAFRKLICYYDWIKYK